MQPPMGLAMDIDPYKYELKEVERLYRGSFPFVTLQESKETKEETVCIQI